MNLENISKESNEDLQGYIFSTVKRAIKRADKAGDERMFDGERYTHTIFVYSNNISEIISIALAATKEVKDYSVYYQPNKYDYEANEFFPYEFQKQQFADFCNYIDKYKGPSIIDFNKILYNYSKDSQKEEFTEYPSDIKMILIVANFNFWDLKSQYILSKLSQNPNIVVIGQIRTDIDFVANHLDGEACTFAAHIQLEE